MKTTIFVTAILLAALAVDAAESDSLSLPVGETTILVPKVPTFVDACSADAKVAELFASTVPASNEMITCFLTPEDFKEITSTGGPELSPYFILQVMTASRNGGISSLQFDSFAKQIETTFRDQFEQFWKSREADTDAQVNRASETASRFLGSEIKLELGQSAPIEVTRLSDTEITSVWMTQASAKVQGKTISSRQVQTSTVILVKGRVLVLFGYQRYKDAADVESLKQLTAQWVKGITELNR